MANSSENQQITYQTGDSYNGTLIDGALSGQGEYRFANGDFYIGGFQQGKFHGFGTYTFANGFQNSGNYINGVLQAASTPQNSGTPEKKSFWKMISDNLKEGYDKGKKSVGGEE